MGDKNLDYKRGDESLTYKWEDIIMASKWGYEILTTRWGDKIISNKWEDQTTQAQKLSEFCNQPHSHQWSHCQQKHQRRHWW